MCCPSYLGNCLHRMSFRVTATHTSNVICQSKSSQAPMEDLSQGWIRTNIIIIIIKNNRNENVHTVVFKQNITGHRLMSFLQIIKVCLSGKFHHFNSFNSSRKITNQGCLWELALQLREKFLNVLVFWYEFFEESDGILSQHLYSFMSFIIFCDNSPSFPSIICHYTDLTF